MYKFQHRYVQEHAAKPPLQPGKYKMVIDHYEVEREPRIGEFCTDYIQHAKQVGTLIRTTYETLTVEK
jgi:hypothetical protein